jgi:hypothetical protein
MKVQWQLVDIETREVLAMLGEPFDFFETVLKKEWELRIKGTGTDEPVGILKSVK